MALRTVSEIRSSLSDELSSLLASAVAPEKLRSFSSDDESNGVFVAELLATLDPTLDPETVVRVVAWQRVLFPAWQGSAFRRGERDEAKAAIERERREREIERAKAAIERDAEEERRDRDRARKREERRALLASLVDESDDAS